ncbi:MAG: hypothetical protein EOO77_37870 [Oxalobacteraceae bacterium]|nr:MAG: hypothetical protein EOO77_37870 [Oxalobacteraceae bacterium]
MQTIVGMFDTTAAANRAVQALSAEGYGSDRVKLTTLPPQTGGSVGTPATEDGFFGAVGHFFSSIFGDDDADRTGSYSEAVRRGHSVVTVDVHSDDEVEAVSNVLDNEGAVDIDERAAQWKSEGALGTAAVAAPVAAAAVATPRVSGFDTQGNEVLNVVQEEIAVGKRTVQKGGLRVVQRVVETPVNEDEH